MELLRKTELQLFAAAMSGIESYQSQSASTRSLLAPALAHLRASLERDDVAKLARAIGRAPVRRMANRTNRLADWSGPLHLE